MVYNSKIVLFQEKKDCCACGACLNACPKQAIEMRPDSHGFLYPIIDESKCIKCGVCNKICGYQNQKTFQTPQSAYAAVTTNHELCMKSASGGIFATFAQYVIKNKGVVFGAAMMTDNKVLNTKHIAICEDKFIQLIQGSKYVQSNIGHIYKDVECYLNSGKYVLFSGTPCQVSGLNGYLKKEYENLITVDIICHGVPSEQFFQDYIKHVIKKQGEIREFIFRDKSKGWGLNAKCVYSDGKGKLRTKTIPFRTSSYYDMFIKSETYRENCYSCPFARSERIGDITLGDFWGIKKQHPEWMENGEGIYSESEGVSCVLVNTQKGEKFLNQVKSSIKLRKTDLYKVVAENHQLLAPSTRPRNRELILNLYSEYGYEAVEKYFIERTGIKIYYYYLVNYIPKPVKNILKHVLISWKKE